MICSSTGSGIGNNQQSRITPSKPPLKSPIITPRLSQPLPFYIVANLPFVSLGRLGNRVGCGGGVERGVCVGGWRPGG